MVYVCSAEGCSNNPRDNRDIPFFSLPKDAKMWVQFLILIKHNLKACMMILSAFHYKYVLINLWGHAQFLSLLTLHRFSLTIIFNILLQRNCIYVTWIWKSICIWIFDPINFLEMHINFYFNGFFCLDDPRPSSSGHSLPPHSFEYIRSSRTIPAPQLFSPKTRRITTQWRTILALRSKINRLKYINSGRMKNKYKERTKVEQLVEECASFLPEPVHVLLTSQILLGKRCKNTRRFSDDLKDIALSMFYHSPKTYRFLRSLKSIVSKKQRKTK